MKLLKLRRCWCLALIPRWRMLCWKHEPMLDDDHELVMIQPVEESRR
jgi:hypothetical protein